MHSQRAIVRSAGAEETNSVSTQFEHDKASIRDANFLIKAPLVGAFSLADRRGPFAELRTRQGKERLHLGRGPRATPY